MTPRELQEKITALRADTIAREVLIAELTQKNIDTYKSVQDMRVDYYTTKRAMELYEVTSRQISKETVQVKKNASKITELSKRVDVKQSNEKKYALASNDLELD